MACVIFVSACQSISVVFFSFVVESVHGISFQLIFLLKTITNIYEGNQLTLIPVGY